MTRSDKAHVSRVFEQELASLRQQVARMETERDTYHQLYLDALEQIRKLERGLLGQKSERPSGTDEQLALDLLGLMMGRDASSASEEADDATL